MQDVLIRKDDDGLYDLEIYGADFASAEGFETSIPVSYFTDARASAVDVQDAKKRRGWVGNILYVDIERELGGLLWLLDQTRITEDTLNFAKSYAEESLQWLVEDGIARLIEVQVEKTDNRKIEIATTITTIDNTVQRYVTLWRATNLSRTI